MTIRVTAPNGATVQFPDGTDRDTIHGVMTQHFGGAEAPADPVTTNDVGRSFASGVPIIGGLLDKADAATNAALAPILNPLFDPKDQLSEPTFGERYAHSLRDQEGADAKFEAQHPIVDKGAKLAGGMAAMVPAMAAAPAMLGVTGSLGARALAGGISNAAIGGADAAARGESPVTGAIVGGLTGAALGPALEGLGYVARNNPIVSNISARINPERFAQRQVARAISESGQTPEQIGRSVTEAAAEGQPEFTVGDAMGNAGQRMLSTVARAPGEGRTAVVDALEGRQGTQGRRISNALAEGFDSPQTAAQTEARLTGARDATANAEYGAVRSDAQPVNVVGAINHIDSIIGTEPGQILAQPNDSIESILSGFRQRLARVNPDDFPAVQRIRGEMSDAAEKASRAGENNKARLVGGAMRQLDAAMEDASAGHLAANRNFAQASRNIDAVQSGRDAAMRGRTEDTIPAFQALPPRGQQAFRAGYVDPLIADVQKAAPGANKARPLLNDAFRAEADAMAPRGQVVNGRVMPGADVNVAGPRMMRRLDREQTMFETRQTALGGSKTMDNQNDHAAMAIDPHLVGAIGHILHGNIGGAVASVGRLAANGWTGNTPEARQQVARILLQRAPTMNRTALENMVNQTVARLQKVQGITRQLSRGVTGALAPTSRGGDNPGKLQ
jgi:hypothetical protein